MAKNNAPIQIIADDYEQKSYVIQPLSGLENVNVVTQLIAISPDWLILKFSNVQARGEAPVMSLQGNHTIIIRHFAKIIRFIIRN